MKRKVLVTSVHPGGAVDALSENFDLLVNSSKAVLPPLELADQLKGCDAAITHVSDRISADLMRSLPDLKMVANVGVGYDNLDIGAASELGILIANTPGVLDQTTADLAFGLLIACARRIVEGDRFVRSGRWQGYRPDLMLGVDVHGKTLGIIGFGRIGKAVAERGRGFGMRIIYSRRARGQDSTDARAVGLDELLSSSDFISLNCPLNGQTYHLIGEREFALMKPDCILVNTARGAIIDQAALIKALRAGRIRAAALDVFEDEPDVPAELAACDRVVLSPHIGSASIETRTAMAAMAAGALQSAFAGNLPKNAVNPDVWDRFLAKL